MCIQNFLRVSTLYRVEWGGGEGELQENFEKHGLFYEAAQKPEKSVIVYLGRHLLYSS